MSSICTDLTIITKVLKSSKFLEVDKDEKLVRRTAPLPEEPDTDQRTLTLLGVSKDSTIDSITKQFSKYGNVNCVRIIKDKKNKRTNRCCIYRVQYNWWSKKINWKFQGYRRYYNTIKRRVLFR